MAERLESFKCPLCVFVASPVALILSHIRLVHCNDPNFPVTCGIGGCSSTSNSFSALYQHIYKKHKDCGIIRTCGDTSKISLPSTAQNLPTPYTLEGNGMSANIMMMRILFTVLNIHFFLQTLKTWIIWIILTLTIC